MSQYFPILLSLRFINAPALVVLPYFLERKSLIYNNITCVVIILNYLRKFSLLPLQFTIRHCKYNTVNLEHGIAVLVQKIINPKLLPYTSCMSFVLSWIETEVILSMRGVAGS